MLGELTIKIWDKILQPILIQLWDPFDKCMYSSLFTSFECLHGVYPFVFFNVKQQRKMASRPHLKKNECKYDHQRFTVTKQQHQHYDHRSVGKKGGGGVCDGFVRTPVHIFVLIFGVPFQFWVHRLRISITRWKLHFKKVKGNSPHKLSPILILRYPFSPKLDPHEFRTIQYQMKPYERGVRC